MNRLYVSFYCILSGIIGAFVGAVAGVGVASLLMRPEEAVVLTTGVGYGGPIGALAGIVFGAVSGIRSIAKTATPNRD